MVNESQPRRFIGPIFLLPETPSQRLDKQIYWNSKQFYVKWSNESKKLFKLCDCFNHSILCHADRHYCSICIPSNLQIPEKSTNVQVKNSKSKPKLDTITQLPKHKADRKDGTIYKDSNFYYIWSATRDRKGKKMCACLNYVTFRNPGGEFEFCNDCKPLNATDDAIKTRKSTSEKVKNLLPLPVRNDDRIYDQFYIKDDKFYVWQKSGLLKLCSCLKHPSYATEEENFVVAYCVNCKPNNAIDVEKVEKFRAGKTQPSFSKMDKNHIQIAPDSRADRVDGQIYIRENSFFLWNAQTNYWTRLCNCLNRCTWGEPGSKALVFCDQCKSADSLKYNMLCKYLEDNLKDKSNVLISKELQECELFKFAPKYPEQRKSNQTYIVNKTKYCQYDFTYQIWLEVCNNCKFNKISESVPFCKTNKLCLSCCYDLNPDMDIPKNFMKKENYLYNELKKKFKHVEFKHNMKIDEGCSRRRPDFFFECFTHSVIVENDENSHRNELQICENKRSMILHTDLGNRPLVLIRFNPDLDNNHKTCFTKDSNNNLQLVESVWKERMIVLINTIEFHLINVPSREYTELKLFYKK